MGLPDDISSSPAAIIGTLAAGVLIKYGVGSYMHWCRKHCYQKVGTVAELYIYPVKSFRGIRVRRADCTKVGLQYHGVFDRHWTVSTRNGVYLTQRQEPKMALIETSLQENTMLLDAPGMKTIRIPIDPPLDKSKMSKVTVKTDTLDSLDCGDDVAEWLCRYFNRDGLRLHFSPRDMEKRDASKAVKTWNHPALPGDLTAFSDYCAYMVLSNPSLAALNERLDDQVPIDNFRANIIVDGCEAFAEDSWKSIRIGEAQLRPLDACTRCVLVTVDQFKGEKNNNEEPLATLKKFRLKPPYGEKPAFGVNAALDAPGSIKVGDPIYAIYYTTDTTMSSVSEFTTPPSVLLATLAATSAMKFAFSAVIRWRYSQDFEQVGRVTALNIFPAKSCSGYSVQSAECTLLGLRHCDVTDRHFLVVKSNGDFLHQRIKPQMALIKFTPEPDDDVITIRAPGMETITVPKDQPVDRSKVIMCRVFDSKLEGQDCGDEAGRWFSRFLNTAGVRLMYAASGLTKKDLPSVHVAWGNPCVAGDQAAFSDFGSYLILSEDSVAALNERLERQVTMSNFRPSIVVKTDGPFQEDNWQEIKIGDTVRMRMLDYCTRCLLTTVDPQTGVKADDGEPLKTLKSFRCFNPYGSSPCFGVNAAVDVSGPVQVGDPVYAILRRS
ncbi:uncharacterized protein LOC121370098 [Gigantopelta aegis]|uniref:uncharacterized protein LOC121370098 n=1 Tax=Gigantopelta aegis TaxID=1735272 RepID=UPI001B88C4F8|nr:uncharacterized protein LOC121370098 [Gigantopelta aegis]